MVADTAALLAEYAKSVGLVYHYYDILVLLLEGNDFRELCKVSFHREDTVYNDEFNGIIRKFAERTLQVYHIIVLVMESLGK